MIEQYVQFGRERARREGDVVQAIIKDLEEYIATNDIGIEEPLEKANEKKQSFPDRYVAEFDSMAESLPVDQDFADLFAFGISYIDTSTDEKDGEGCTNVLIPSNRSRSGSPLILKNRDIKGRGLRPQVLLEQPAVDELHGFITVTSAGVPGIYQGVNSTGLAVANTYVDASEQDLSRREYVRNGTVVRRVLEECATVTEARTLIDTLPLSRMSGMTLFLADASASVVLEIDPLNGEIRENTEGIIPMANHFPSHPETEYESSVDRYERATERTRSFPERATFETLTAFASDHENGPGPNSICRHPSGEADTFTLTESTTVSSCLFKGGDPTIYCTFSSPCSSSRETFTFGGDHASEYYTGQRWRSETSDRSPLGAREV